MLLVIVLFSGYLLKAQTNLTDENCKAGFKYEIKDILMSPVANTPVQFYDVSEGEISSWFWDFGDGNTSQEENPFYVYYYPDGAHDGLINPYRVVTLTVLTIDSCISTYSDTVTILNTNLGCSAGFKYYQSEYDTVNNRATFQFSNLSEGESLSYFWNFGNGETSMEKEPMIIFDSNQDTYSVCLVIHGLDNCSDSLCTSISIVNPYKPDIDSSECFVKFGYTVNYDVQTFAPALVLDFLISASRIA